MNNLTPEQRSAAASKAAKAFWAKEQLRALEQLKHAKMNPLVKELTRTRLLKGMNRKELARKIGVSEFTINRYELERASPNVAMLQAWAGALGFELQLTLKVP